MINMKIVSGIRPTGNIHLGNYLGAIKQWKELQKKHDCVFFVADLHSQNNCKEAAVTKMQLRNCGVSNEFIWFESDFKAEILELYHDLSFQVPTSWLNRMTQFKDKSRTEETTLALLSYPVLMAADIFYFGGTHIPIGDDQKQHIEFVRDLAQRTGHVMPEPIIGQYPRIMSLTDGTKKMSKSDPNDMSRINLSDSADVIRLKIMKAKSASDVSDVTPEMTNLWNIFYACGGAEDSDFSKVKDFKLELAELIVKEIYDQARNKE